MPPTSNTLLRSSRLEISEKFSIFHVNLPYRSIGCGPAEGDAWGRRVSRRREGAAIFRRRLARRRLVARIGANRRVRTRKTRKNLRKASRDMDLRRPSRRRARGATRRATVAGRVSGHEPVESSSPHGPEISPTPSRGPRRARHSASAGLSGVTVRLPSPWRSEDATPLDELPPPAPPAPPPPPPAPRGPELPPLDIVFRRFTRRKPPPPPRGYACPVSDCHHGKISVGAKRRKTASAFSPR
jgi:hypothetical protein